MALLLFHLHYAAEIVSHPEELTEADIGDTVVLTCVAYGSPAPYITWSKNDTNISNDSQVAIYEQVVPLRGIMFVRSTLEIGCATEEDGDKYTCTAANRHVKSSFSTNLSVNAVGKLLIDWIQTLFMEEVMHLIFPLSRSC